MSKYSLAGVALLFIACGGAESAPVEEPTAAPAIADEALPAESEEAIAPSETPEEPAEPSGVAAKVIEDRSACMGTELDLVTLSNQGSCDLESTAAPLPQGIAVTIQRPKVEVQSGKEVELEVVFTNTNDKAVALDLDASCGFHNVIDSQFYTKSGKRMDRFNRHCAALAKNSCAGKVVGVELKAGGKAIIRHPVMARVTAMADDCGPYSGRDLSPGTYKLTVKTPFADKALDGSMKVLAIPRIPTKQCRSYADKVAAMAEPDAAQRKEVASTLFKGCRKQAPSKELAECQLAAETPEALAACRGR